MEARIKACIEDAHSFLDGAVREFEEEGLGG